MEAHGLFDRRARRDSQSVERFGLAPRGRYFAPHDKYKLTRSDCFLSDLAQLR